MKTLIALILYRIGIKPHCSTFIDGDSITMGYGQLDGIGMFKYDLPNWVIIKEFKSTSWDKAIEIDIKSKTTK